MGNEIAPKQTLSLEQATYEQLIKSNTANALASELHLTETQKVKANQSLLVLLGDEKLNGTTQLSKLRYCYSVAVLNYKNTRAVAPIKYGDSVQAQLQYQAYIEDMLECGGVEETNAVVLFKDIDYKAHINKLGFTELELPETIELANPFEKKEIIGYYAYAKCVDGRIATCVMSKGECEEYAMKYSKSQRAFKSGKVSSSVWNDQFDTMALKTCIKAVARQVLKWFPFDRLDKAIQLDQAVFEDSGVKYSDNANRDDNAKPTPDNVVVELPKTE